MKNGNRKDSSGAVIAFWQKILLDGEIFKIAGKFRKKIMMPIDGFVFYDEWEKWREINIKKDKKWDSKRIKNAYAFIRAVKEKYPQFKGILIDSKFNKILIEFYYFNNVDDDTLNKCFGFEVLLIDKGRERILRSKIKNGIYIKITSQASIDGIKKYIDNNKKLIRNAQELFRLTEKIPIYKKLKIHGNFKRDNVIQSISNLTRKELEEFAMETKELKRLARETRDFSCKGMLRESLIAKILKEKYSGITSEIVKTVLQRRRKMSKAKQYLRQG